MEMAKKEAEPLLVRTKVVIGDAKDAPPSREGGDKDHTILRIIGEKVLLSIIQDALDLLESSAAIYEKDGRCAIGVFSSEWCHFLDDSFRNDDPGNDLEAGGHLCHHRCWSETTDLVRRAGGPVDRPCPGGLRIYAVPILANGEVIGSINIGYGDPPNDPKVLKAIAHHYGLNEDILAEVATAYGRKPANLVRASKNRIQVAAQLIGAIVEKQVAEEKMSEKAKQLEASNADLERFAYIASHDIREPLRTISTYLELLQRRYGDSLDDHAKEMIEESASTAYRAHSLVEDLLTYSRVGGRVRSMETVDMDKTLKAAMANLSAAIEKENARIVCAPLPPVCADGQQMVQLLQNLVANGIKFHGTNAPEVHVSAERRDGFLVFSVSDNGIGIREEDRPRMFQMFQRLNALDRYQGSGIGLAVCRKIVERHGGRIWFESEVDKGTTFCFSLPESGPGPGSA